MTQKCSVIWNAFIIAELLRWMFAEIGRWRLQFADAVPGSTRTGWNRSPRARPSGDGSREKL